MSRFDNVPASEQAYHAIQADLFFEIEPARVIIDRYNTNRGRDLDVFLLVDFLGMRKCRFVIRVIELREARQVFEKLLS